VIRVKRNYRAWVANETLEDYSLRYAAQSYRKWSPYLLANTALGGISFLALEAIGGALTISYGFANVFPAVIVASLLIFATSLPITYYASRYNVDMDLLTRGAGFGYIGSTVTSLIYASFTFIFFALEAAIMAQAVELYFGIPLVIGYVACALVIIPITFFGVTLINRLQLWTQPLWAVLLIMPFFFILGQEPELLAEWSEFAGRTERGASFDFLFFGAATGVLFSLVVQVGEQVDYLRFLPECTPRNRWRWWISLISAGPGWILIGGAKILAGGLLAYIVLRDGAPLENAVEPIHMYVDAYGFVFDDAGIVILAATVFVIVSQVKINVTNAYAGSLAWGNFFSRVTHYHPGRVTWLIFNVLIALLLMLLGIFDTLEAVLSVYANVAIAWIGAIFADLVVLKPLGVSPSFIEFKRAHLYNVNPVGCGAMLVASVLSIVAFSGAFGELARVYSAFLSLTVSFVAAIVIGFVTKGRYYIARDDPQYRDVRDGRPVRCCTCERTYEPADMANCPFYDGPICSLCCTLDSHCHDVCKRTEIQHAPVTARRSPPSLTQPTFRPSVTRRLSRFALLFSVFAIVAGAVYLLSYRLIDVSAIGADVDLVGIFERLYAGSLALMAIGAWWIVLSHESRELAESELVNSLHHLEMTQKELVQSEKMASLGGLVAGVAHEINTPVGITVTAASFLQDRTRALREQQRNGPLEAKALNEYLDDAEESARLLLDNATRAAALIQSFKQVAVDRTSDEHRRFNLRQYLQETVASLRPELRKTRHRVEIDCPSDMQIDGYPGPLAQAITNLVINSLRHGYRVEDAGTIRLEARIDEDDMVELRCIDDGQGIPASIRTKIFDPFFTTKRGKGGSGLGLHLVYNIVTQKLDGSIQVEDKDAGAAFVLRFPRSHARLVHHRGAI
jgi:signal transduction histidine kinase/purine-cytosine permease-like protein